MNDEEFEKYLEAKYGENIWQLHTLTPQELVRCKPMMESKVKELLKEGAKDVTHFPRGGLILPDRSWHSGKSPMPNSKRRYK